MNKVILNSIAKSIFRISLLCLLLSSIGLIWDVTAFSCGFLTPTTVASSGSIGIVTDSNGKVYISYFDATNGDLKYAKNTSGNWINSTIDYNGGKYGAIAIDSNNKLHISYHGNGSYRGLNYATNVSGTWVNYLLDDSDYNYYTGLYTSIAVDSNNKVHISYYYGSGDRLMYITNASGSWVSSTVDYNLGLYRNFVDEPGTSIAIDSNNKVHIAYLTLNANDCITQSCTHTTMEICSNTISIRE